MQEKKNKARFIMLAVLTAATMLVFWWIQPENRLDVDQDIFQVEDLSAVSEVRLKSDSATVSLSFNGTRWRVNDAYDADAGMIRVLFATLQQARPKRPVARAQVDSTYRHLEENGIEISLFSGRELQKRFIAGGNSAKTQAFFADPGTREVYVMTIPGYRVYVSGIFEMEENGWRDKFVFAFNWRNFKSLEASFTGRPAENFTVAMHNDYFGVEGLAATDTARLNTYLDDVSLLTVDEYVSEPRLIDSLRQVSPTFQLTVTDAGSREYRLRLFRGQGGGRILGLVGESQGAVFEPQKIQPLLRPKSFFSKK